MTKRGRDRRVARRAQQRADKRKAILIPGQNELDSLVQSLLTPVPHGHLSAEAVEQITELAQLPPDQTEEKMRALGVPSFSEWLETKGKQVISNAAMDGKPGAFLLLKLMAEHDGREGE
jgi:hypothetical protein